MSTDTIRPGAGLSDDLTDDEMAAMRDDGADESPAEAPAAEPVTEEAPAAEAGAPKKEEITEDDLDNDDVVEGLANNPGKFIRHGAFHRQREIAKSERKQREEAQALVTQLQTERSREAAERARIDERLRLLMEATQEVSQPQQGQGQEIPDPDVDPFAYMKYLNEQINRVAETSQGAQRRFEEQDHTASVKTAFIDEARGYAAKQSDFMDAYQHLLRSRDMQLQRLGKVDPRERAAIINQEEMQIVSECFRNRRSPSELMYQLAHDVGYRKAEPAPLPVGGENGAAPAAQGAPTAAEVVENVRKGQAASRSLGSVAGGGSRPLTAELLASMPEAEFQAAVSKMSREEKRERFGGPN